MLLYSLWYQRWSLTGFFWNKAKRRGVFSVAWGKEQNEETIVDTEEVSVWVLAMMWLKCCLLLHIAWSISVKHTTLETGNCVHQEIIVSVSMLAFCYRLLQVQHFFGTLLSPAVEQTAYKKENHQNTMWMQEFIKSTPIRALKVSDLVPILFVKLRSKELHCALLQANMWTIETITGKNALTEFSFWVSLNIH